MQRTETPEPLRLKVLVISDLYPTPQNPVYGSFVHYQTRAVTGDCQMIVVAPVRVFPPLRLWKQIIRPRRFLKGWRAWWQSLQAIPTRTVMDGIEIYYPRYTSMPRQGFHATWGFFAFLFLWRLLKRLHDQYQFDLIHAHYASPAGVIAILARRWMKIPVVVTVHGSDVTYTVGQHRFSAAIIRWVFQHADCITANSTWTARKIMAAGGAPDRIVINYYGTDFRPEISDDSLQKYGSQATLSSTKPMILLTVAHLVKRKGHKYMIRALPQLLEKGYTLRYEIVGDGEERQSLEKLVQSLGLSSIVTFHGAITHDQLPAFYSQCDIFVLPSWDEAFGIVFIEALRFAKPIIGCAGTGGPEDLKAMGDCVELVEPHSVEALVGAVERLSSNPARAQQMAITGQALVRQQFGWKHNAQRTLAIYEQVLNADD